MNYLFKKMTDCIKNSDKVVIMTHKNPDLDGMGSAISLCEVIKNMKKDCFIAFSKGRAHKSLDKGIKLLKEDNINFLNLSDIKKIVTNDTLLIILDVANSKLVEYEELLEMKKIIIIDHHMNSANDINNLVAYYIDSNKSSVAEIITEYLKYLNMKIKPIFLTLLLAGIEMDTHCYKVKTSDKTFLAASYLVKNGADNYLKNEMFKVDQNEIIKNLNNIKQSYFIKEGFILCNMDEITDIGNIAILADELLRIDKVKASFVLGKINNDNIYISARSFGQVNVAEIMKELGGGGHVTDAAAQLHNKTLEEVIHMIKKALGGIK